MIHCTGYLRSWSEGMTSIGGGGVSVGGSSGGGGLMGGGVTTCSDGAGLGLPEISGSSADVSPGGGGGLDAETADNALSCLVAVGRLLPASVTIQQMEAATISTVRTIAGGNPGAAAAAAAVTAAGGDLTASSSGSSASAGSASGSPIRRLEFTARHTIDGNFSFADSHVAMVMG